MILDPHWENTNGHKRENMLILTEEKKKKKRQESGKLPDLFHEYQMQVEKFSQGRPSHSDLSAII